MMGPIYTGDAETLKAILNDPPPHVRECVLCKNPAHLLGVYKPGDPKTVQAPAGKTRLIIYGLCEGCAQQPDSAVRVEEKILSDIWGDGHPT